MEGAVMRLAIYSLVSLKLAVVCWLGVMLTGCSHLPWQSTPEVRVSGVNLSTDDVYGRLQAAETALGLKHKGKLEVRGQPGEQNITTGTRCPGGPFWCRMILGEWRGGQTGGGTDSQRTDLYTSPTGDLSPCEIRNKLPHEMGRAILCSHSIYGAEQDAKLKEAGIW